MVKHTQTIRRQKPTNCLSLFDHYVGLTLKGLIKGVDKTGKVLLWIFTDYYLIFLNTVVLQE